MKNLAQAKLFHPYVTQLKLTDSVWNQIAARMSEPHRHYHTLHHLAMMFTHWYNLWELVPSDCNLIYSILMHDVIYDPTRSDNEERSANLARLLAPASVDIEVVVAAILATKTHQIADGDQKTKRVSMWLNEFDLRILSANRNTYAWYARGIRREYAHVPDAAYRQGRTAVLKKLAENWRK